MEFPAYPSPDVLVARLVRSHGAGVPKDDVMSEEEFLSQLAEQVGLHSHDLFLVAGLSIPDDELRYDEEASRELPRLVRHALTLPAAGRQRLRDHAQSMVKAPDALQPRKERPYEQYPPGFGSLLVRMLALRNLGWSSAVRTMHLMSGVPLSASTIGAIGRGTAGFYPRLLNGFAAVLGVPVAVLVSLTGIHHPEPDTRPPAEVVDTAALLWDARHLTAEQVRQLLQLAE